MRHDKEFRSALAVPAWQEPAAARAELEARMETFIRAALDVPASVEEPAPALAFRVSPGLGKTSTAQRLLARHGRDLLSHGHVLVYVPTLDLAERAARELIALDPELPVAVVRGRRAKRPGGEEFMCERLDLVDRVEGLVHSVTEALCRVEWRGKMHEAPCAAACPYLAQKDAKGSQIVFLAHNYLSLSPPIDSAVPVALRIVDEKVWPMLVRPSQIPVEEFLRAMPPSFPEELRAEHVRARAVIVDALQSGASLHDRLADAGLTPGFLLALAEAEADTQKSLEIRPWMSPGAANRVLDFFDARRLSASRKRQQVLRLAASRPSGQCGRLQLEEARLDDARTQEVVRIFDMVEIPRDCPVLLLDADADPEIVSRTLPGAQFVRFDVAPMAHIVQVGDRTLSHAWLTAAATDVGKQRVSDVLGLVEREVARASGRGVLLVATRPVLTLLHEAEGQPTDGDEDLRRSIRGAEPRWFGPRMQGVNDYADFATVVTVGRLQPWPADVERAARCLFGGDEEPLRTIEGGGLHRRGTSRLMRDGRLVDAAVQSHPDERAERVLMQMREAATLQAIARLRLLTPSRPKRVVVVSSLPLPDFPVDTLTTWRALARGIEDDSDPAGFEELERALRATMGRQVRGMRLSAAGLCEDLPCDFPTIGVAERFRRGRSTAAVRSLARRIAGVNGWPLTEVELSVPRKGGRPVPAIVLVEPRCARRAADQLWPGHHVHLL